MAIITSSLFNDKEIRGNDEIALWVWLITHAQYSHERVRNMTNFSPIYTERGDVLCRAKDIKLDTSIDRKRQNRIFKRWIDVGMIEKTVHKGGTVITLLNYEKYQTSQKENVASTPGGRKPNIREVTDLTAAEFHFQNMKKAYPNKNRVNREAFEIFCLMQLNSEIEAILLGIEAWANSDEWSEIKYVPNLSKFLKERQWEMQPEPKQKKKSKGRNKPKSNREILAEQRAKEQGEMKDVTPRNN